MDLKKLEYLLQVAEYGSFTKAAAVIGIAQPALGRQVQKLEEECGVRLLYRHGRGVGLTPEGETLLERVRPLVRQLQSAALDLREDAGAASGLVTIGMTPIVRGLIALPLLASLRSRYPKLQLNVVEGYSGYIHEWLMNARVDVAILHDARRSQQMLVEPLAAAKLSLISPPGTASLANASSGAVPLKRLAGLPLVLPSKNHGLRRALEYAMGRIGVGMDIHYEVDTVALAVDVVRAGLAHTVLCHSAVHEEHQRGEVTARLLRSPEVEIRLMLARSASRPMTRSVTIVEEAVREQIRQAAKRFPLQLKLGMDASARQTLKA